MASMNSLLISWNFDKVTTSDNSGQFTADDSVNNYYGTGCNFANKEKVVTKDSIKSRRNDILENIDSSETIRTSDEDDKQINLYNKPASVQLILENSMYQIISDEMLNMFSTIDSYAFKFTESSNKYKSEYNNLFAARKDFFSKILEKPNIEKYIEFYKWLDSSLGYMLDQLKPESSTNVDGLKITVESHILERNKYKHELPLNVDSNRVYTSGISVIKSAKGSVTDAISASNKQTDPNMVYASGGFNTANISNILNKNYFNNYEILQTAGKHVNHRNQKTGSSVFVTKFSSVDGLSEKNRTLQDEYSVYNDLNQKSKNLRDLYNFTSSISTEIQGSNDIFQSGGIDYNTSNFQDNNFIQRNIPYTSSNYTAQKLVDNSESSVNYQNIPSPEVEFRHYTNILIDENKHRRPSKDINYTGYRRSSDMVEPPIYHSLPLKQNFIMLDAVEEIEAYSPYSTFLDTFSQRNLLRNNKFIYLKANNLKDLSDKYTFFRKTQDKAEFFRFYRTEKLDVIFPRSDLIGLARIRSKATRFEEERGYKEKKFQEVLALNNLNLLPGRNLGNYIYNDSTTPYIEPWSDNSYNNNSSRIRSFWRDDIQNRKRTRGIDLENPELFLLDETITGSINCLNYPNLKEKPGETVRVYSISSSYTGNVHNSIYAMDSVVQYDLSNDPDVSYGTNYITCSGEIYGDIGSISHFYANRFLVQETERNNIIPQVKPFFTYTAFVNRFFSGSNVDNFVINKSYQTGLDCKIRPFYDTYDQFRGNIKHRSQDASIIPEFNVSNFPQLIESYEDDAVLYKNLLQEYTQSNAGQPILKQVNIPKYLTIYGTEKYDQLNYEDFYCDLKQFVDKKNNKIKIKLRGTKKLLPYNGFYPQQKTAQIAATFQNEYIYKNDNTPQKTEGFVDPFNESQVFANLNLKVHFQRRQALMSFLQPLFMPGILFNTIKSGIGVSWPIATLYDSSEIGFTGAAAKGSDLWNLIYITGSQQGYNENTNLYRERFKVGVRKLTYNLPFETILSPARHFKDLLISAEQSVQSGQNFYSNGYEDRYPDGYEYFYLDSIGSKFVLPYLDSTHFSTFIEFNNTGLYNGLSNAYQIFSYFKEDKKLYISEINNFTAEIVNFFLKDGRLTYFRSLPESQFKSVFAGKKYAMDVVILKNKNFSMFNQYPSGSTPFVPFNSLFGPAVQNVYSEDIGKNTEASASSAYLPFSPPYLNEEDSRITIVYEPQKDLTRATIEDIITNSTVQINIPSSASLELLGLNTASLPPVNNGIFDNLESFKKRMTLKDCMHFNIQRSYFEKTYDPVTGLYDKEKFLSGSADKSLVFQTKFETPLLNFTKCSTVSSGSWGVYDSESY